MKQYDLFLFLESCNKLSLSQDWAPTEMSLKAIWTCHLRRSQYWFLTGQGQFIHYFRDTQKFHIFLNSWPTFLQLGFLFFSLIYSCFHFMSLCFLPPQTLRSQTGFIFMRSFGSVWTFVSYMWVCAAEKIIP